MRLRYPPEYKAMYAPILEVLKIFGNKYHIAEVAGLRWHTVSQWCNGNSAPTLVHLGKLAKAFPFAKERLLDAIGKGWDTLPPPPPRKPRRERISKERQHRPLRLQATNPHWATSWSWEEADGSVPDEEAGTEDHGTTG